MKEPFLAANRRSAGRVKMGVSTSKVMLSDAMKIQTTSNEAMEGES